MEKVFFLDDACCMCFFDEKKWGGGAKTQSKNKVLTIKTKNRI
jgi:hypothetical protein